MHIVWYGKAQAHKTHTHILKCDTKFISFLVLIALNRAYARINCVLLRKSNPFQWHWIAMYTLNVESRWVSERMCVSMRFDRFLPLYLFTCNCSIAFACCRCVRMHFFSLTAVIQIHFTLLHVKRTIAVNFGRSIHCIWNEWFDFKYILQNF